MLNKIPVTLIYSRLAIGLAILLLSILRIDNYSTIAIILLSLGLLTDIFDGIIARRLGVSTESLRRLDSSIDQVFFMLVGLATIIQAPDYFRSNAVKLIILLSAEGLAYLICFIKFKKEIATHSIGAKIWTLFLFGTLVEIILYGQSTWLFNIFFWLGLVTRIEIIAIILILRQWTNDVPSIYHAKQIRQGKEIKRNKLFNG